MLLIRKLLAAFVSCLPIHVAASASTEAGLIGPQNAMLMLNGFHFISGAPDHYLQANHHCALMNGTIFEAFIQCVLYIPGTNPARLAGIEYIVSGDAFATFPMEERQLWHSHQFEVSSGYLIEPGMPANVDKEIMKILVNSYGKTVHTWRYDQKNKTLPFGIPELVNGYTGHGQLPANFVEERDDYWGVNTTEIRESRKDITVPAVEPGADAWKQGIILTLGLVNHTSNTTFEH
jgi:Protein of unknown function (DUF1264)